MFVLAPWAIALVVSVAMQVVGYLIMARPKTEKSESVTDMEAPTAEEGRPVPVPFGEVEITGLNIIWYGDKETRTYEVDA